MDTGLYTALKLGRMSETGREKRVMPEFGEYWRRKFIPPNSGCYTHGPTCHGLFHGVVCGYPWYISFIVYLGQACLLLLVVDTTYTT
jgi:hypothetical protein